MDMGTDGGTKRKTLEGKVWIVAMTEVGSCGSNDMMNCELYYERSEGQIREILFWTSVVIFTEAQ